MLAIAIEDEHEASAFFGLSGWAGCSASSANDFGEADPTAECRFHLEMAAKLLKLLGAPAN